jgi:hypothetical protein
VTGTVSVPILSDPEHDWQRLNDGNPLTYAHTGPPPNNDNIHTIGWYMELDLGEGGKMTTWVRIRHRPDVPYKLRSNGCVLYVMDNDRTVVFEHTFSGMTNESPTEEEFNIL